MNLVSDIKGTPYLGAIDLDKEGQPTDAALTELDKQYGKVHVIEAVDGKGFAIVREPSPKDVSLATAAQSAKNNPLEFNRTLYIRCLVAATANMVDETTYYPMSASASMSELVSIPETKLKKR